MKDLQEKFKDLHIELRSTGSTSGQILVTQGIAIEAVKREIEELKVSQQHTETARHQRATEQENKVQSSETQILAGQYRLEMKIDAIQAERAVRAAHRLAVSPAQPSSSDATQSTYPILVSASRTQWKCSPHCMCACHRRYNAKSPQILRRFLGLLFLGYAGLPMITPPCDTKFCMQPTSPNAIVTYHFPLWLLARVVAVAIKLSMHEGPQFSLRVSRVVDGSSGLFMAIQFGNVDQVKALLYKRIDSPFDVSSVTGYSALMVRTFENLPNCEELSNLIRH